MGGKVLGSVMNKMKSSGGSYYYYQYGYGYGSPNGKPQAAAPQGRAHSEERAEAQKKQ